VTVDERDVLARQFEENRSRLRAVAYRMLGSATEADDAVQETWLRLSRADADAIDNLGGWLTTVVARVCLNMLRSRTTRREQPLDEPAHDELPDEAVDPEREAVLADSVGLAMLVVLDALDPAERLAFVLHDMFAVPFDEIAVIVDRSPAAARQLASRARRRVQGASIPDDDLGRRREVVDAFLAAARGGDFEALVALLDPDVVLRADHAVVAYGAPGEVRGVREVAEQFAGRARAAQPASIDGSPGLVWARGGVAQVVFDFTIRNGKVVQIEMLGDAELLGELELQLQLPADPEIGLS
jgi:RNA polymerase sigma-70 factor (ECF subfamily)